MASEVVTIIGNNKKNYKISSGYLKMSVSEHLLPPPACFGPEGKGAGPYELLHESPSRQLGLRISLVWTPPHAI
jgi:hypothetical protein